jgi:hypothetical protein
VGSSTTEATRLARVIVQDIALYSVELLARAPHDAEARQALADLEAEGRALFRGRLGRPHWPLYEAALESLRGKGRPPLDTRDGAARLAAAVLDEAERLSADVPDRLACLDREVARARRAFRRQVASQWHGLYEQTLGARAAVWLRGRGGPGAEAV